MNVHYILLEKVQKKICPDLTSETELMSVGN